MYYEKIFGWSQMETQGKMLEHFITESNWMSKQKIRIAEIGVFRGRSIAIFNEVLCKHIIPHEIIGIDHFEGSPEHQSGMYPMPNYEEALHHINNIKQNNLLAENITLVKSNSLDIVDSYGNNTFDMVYIDASHEYEPVKQDIQCWKSKVKKGGYLCGDDYCPTWNGVMNAVDELIPERKIIASTQWYIKL